MHLKDRRTILQVDTSITTMGSIINTLIIHINMAAITTSIISSTDLPRRRCAGISIIGLPMAGSNLGGTSSKAVNWTKE